MIRLLVVLVIAALPLPALAQPAAGETGRIGERVRTATQQDFVGFWQLLPYPDALQPRHLPQNPWPQRCQIFWHQKDGGYSMIYAMSGNAACETRNAAFWETTRRGAPVEMEYKVKDGLVAVVDRRRNTANVWKIEIVTQDFEAPGIEAKSGDLVMQMVDLQKRQVLWRRFLRRVPE